MAPAPSENDHTMNRSSDRRAGAGGSRPTRAFSGREPKRIPQAVRVHARLARSSAISAARWRSLRSVALFVHGIWQRASTRLAGAARSRELRAGDRRLSRSSRTRVGASIRLRSVRDQWRVRSSAPPLRCGSGLRRRGSACAAPLLSSLRFPGDTLSTLGSSCGSVVRRGPTAGSPLRSLLLRRRLAGLRADLLEERQRVEVVAARLDLVAGEGEEEGSGLS